jgi:glycine/D-amino acid oxidase-like deaminating enzyme
MNGIPISEASPIAFSERLPQAADTVVIGGGVIGVSAAYFLAEKGERVVLLEKGRIAGEQSSRNWGWIRCQGRDPAELPIAIEAQALWERLDAEAAGATGLARRGVTYLANSEAEMARFEAWLPHARAHGRATRLLTRAEVAEMFPGHKADWAGGLVTPTDARAEPWAAVSALARLAAGKGAAIAEACAARALDLSGGKVAGVVAEKGRIACERVLLAGGAWSSLFLARHGLGLPQLSVKATVAATEALPSVHEGNAADSRFAFRRRADGGYSLAPCDFHEFFIGPDAFRHLPKFLPQLRGDPFGNRYLPWAPKGYPDAWGTKRRWAEEAPSPFERMRILNPAPNKRRVERIRRAFAAAFPALGEVRIKTAWAGMIDTMPDIVPVVDWAPIPGLFVATGMSGHGFGIGPAFGRIIADLMTGARAGHDLARFRYGRFADGSKITLGPSI